jgi:multidrug resistance protein, MATE family
VKLTSIIGYIGAPIATSLGKMFGFFCFLGIIMIFKLYKTTWFGIQFKEALNPKEMWKFLLIAVPGSVQICFEIWGFFLMTIPAMFLGEKYLDAFSLTVTVSALTFMVPLALSVSASVRVGNCVGEGDIKSAKMSTFITLSLGVCK